MRGLRRSFITAVGQYIEVVRDEVKERTVARGGGTFWLVHVRPRRSGHYAIRYTYKEQDSFHEGGANELYIRVGARVCRRDQQPQIGITGVCLGDTVILPIRLNDLSEHRFSIKYTYEKPLNAEAMSARATTLPTDVRVTPVQNPLASNLKYLGTQRYELLHRNGGMTVVYSAFFEATGAGRFNLALSSTTEGVEEAPARSTPNLYAAGATPVIIVNPGTNITALISGEDVTKYADGGRFSSHTGNSFPTNLLILQPGEVFSLEYSHVSYRRDSESRTNAAQQFDMNLKPVIHRLPFMLNPDWSYNEWLVDSLPRS